MTCKLEFRISRESWDSINKAVLPNFKNTSRSLKYMVLDILMTGMLIM